MCLAVPMEVMQIDQEQATCSLDGVVRSVSLIMLDDVAVGDYVLIHAGFAIEKLDAHEAHETLKLLRQLLESSGDGA